MATRFTTISTKGQLVIPSDMRAELGIAPGTRVSITVQENRIIVQPINKDLVLSLKGIAKGGWSMEDEIQKDRRSEKVITYALDASAVLRYLEDQEGADRVVDLIEGGLVGDNKVVISAVHWGEIGSVYCRKYGLPETLSVLNKLASCGIEIIPVTAESALKAGLIRADKKIPYVDAFGVELAATSPDHILVTADFDVAPAKDDVRIEFLPVKLKPN